MTFDLPRGRVLPVQQARIRLRPDAHPFELQNRQAIERNWQSEVAANPALFDGEVVLLSDLAFAHGELDGHCHVIHYSTFMYWRRSKSVASAEHAYAQAMPVSSDNALVLIRMAAHTVNAGRVYFAAGSFEPQDFRDGIADIDANMAREVAEETGIDITGCRRDENFHFRSSASGSVIFRRYYLDESADRIARRIKDFVAGQAVPEIEGPVIVRSADDLPQELALHVPAMVAWHFATTS